mmetsp:Transcript_5506/g.14236  ORF Transcript_5506/g.14236 Transcript_5506/m.14236 type:complete len:87 (+) Transcript_5506:27-287(+)
MVESRVLGCIPQREALGVQAVHVVPPKVPPSATIFRGGVLMGLLDFVQENWVQRREWASGGVNVGAPKGFNRMNKLSLQLLWHGAY